MNVRRLIFTLVLLGGVGPVRADFVPYYIGVDSLSTIASGTYAGLANPNQGRLTLLYNHGDHYHSKGIFTYSGPNLGNATAVATSASNYLPEGSAPPFELTPGTGAFAGLYVSGQTPEIEGSAIRIGSVDALSGQAAGSEASVLFNSSGGRWTTSLAQAPLAIELVSTTPGLAILDGSGAAMFGSSSIHALGLGGATLDFAPIFAAAGPGNYAASFRLVDTRTSGGFGASGVFEYRFAVAAVPEPSGLALSALSALGATVAASLRRSRDKRADAPA